MKKPIFAILALAAFASTPTHAALVNAGFEDDNVFANGANGGVVPTGWSNTSSGGPHNFYLTDGANLAPYGIAGAHTGDQYLLLHTAGNGALARILQDDASLTWADDVSIGDTISISVWMNYR